MTNGGGSHEPATKPADQKSQPDAPQAASVKDNGSPKDNGSGGKSG